MKLYVFEDVLKDWTAGMVLVAANSEDEAVELCLKEFEGKREDWEDGLTGTYPLAASVGNPEGKACLLHHVYGGG